MNNLFLKFIFLICFGTNILFATIIEKVTDIKEINYNIVLHDNTEFAIDCDEFYYHDYKANKKYNSIKENGYKFLEKTCINSKDSYKKINYSTLKNYLKDSKLVIDSFDLVTPIFGSFDKNLTIYLVLKTPKPANTRILFWKTSYNEDDYLRLKVLNNINNSTINVKFFKEDKNNLLIENFKIVEYISSLESKEKIIELDKPIDILYYETINTYNIDENKECFDGYIYYKKYNKTLYEKCKSIPIKNLENFK